MNSFLCYFLTYSQHYDRDKGQDNGRLCLRSIQVNPEKPYAYTGRTHEVWVATCSSYTKQYTDSFHDKGGLMPPEYRVPKLYSWTVTLEEQYRATIGIEGKCFQILPVYVTTDKGGYRGEFFIHRDANVPGSQGCIVLTGERFQHLIKTFASLREQGYKELPLFVTYS
jgi:hypothetical protein